MLSKEYIAGFFDGEGCISLSIIKCSGQYKFYVSIDQKDPTILGWILIQYPEARLEKYDKAFSLRFIGLNAKRFLTDILELSIYKKPQILLALEYLDTVNLQGKHISDNIRIKRDNILNELKNLKVYTRVI